MASIIDQMLSDYKTNSLIEKTNAMKEIMQEIILCGLSRAGFFKKAAFYGGTALRIFYGLDRFSEDLDFSLIIPDPSFDIKQYFPILEKEVRSFGLNVTITEKKKSVDSSIKSAFLKGNTKEHLLLFYVNDNISQNIQKDEVIRIKFEVDIDPPSSSYIECKYRLLPAPYEITMYDMPSLFAGKIHAILCRSWKSRTKGRDLYDYVFFVTHKTKVNQKHLKERLFQSKYISNNDECSINSIKAMLKQKFETIDYEEAKRDVLPFIHDNFSLSLWNKDFFIQITDTLEIE